MKELAFALLCCLVTAPAAADVTLTGSANPNKDVIWEWTPVVDGQVTAALSWKSKGADLFVLLACSDSSTTLVFGVGLADGNDRFQRIESGLIAGTVCGIAVASRGGGSKFTLHIVGASGLTKDSIARRSLTRIRAQDLPGLPEMLEGAKRLP